MVNSALVVSCILVAIYYPQISTVLRYGARLKSLGRQPPHGLTRPAPCLRASQVHWRDLWPRGRVSPARGLPPRGPAPPRPAHRAEHALACRSLRTRPRQFGRPVLLGGPCCIAAIIVCTGRVAQTRSPWTAARRQRPRSQAPVARRLQQLNPVVIRIANEGDALHRACGAAPAQISPSAPHSQTPSTSSHGGPSPRTVLGPLLEGHAERLEAGARRVQVRHGHADVAKAARVLVAIVVARKVGVRLGAPVAADRFAQR